MLRIAVEDGTVVRAEQLLVSGVASEDGRAPFGPDGGYAPEAEIEAGDTITVWVDSDDSVGIIFHDIDTEKSTTVDRWSGDD